MPSHTSNTNNSCLYGGNESLLITASNNAVSPNGALKSIDQISNADKDFNCLIFLNADFLSSFFNMSINLVI